MLTWKAVTAIGLAVATGALAQLGISWAAIPCAFLLGTVVADPTRWSEP